MKKIMLPILAICAIAFSTMGGCASTGPDAGGIGGTGLHGGLDVGTTINPTDPTNVAVNVGGHINFARRPLTTAEKQEAAVIAFKAGVDFATERSEASVQTTSLTKAKANCFRNLTYRYRVDYSHNKNSFLILKQISNSNFDEGYKSATTPQSNAGFEKFKRWRAEVTPITEHLVFDYRNGQPNALVLFQDGRPLQCNWTQAETYFRAPNWCDGVLLPVN